MDRKNRNGTNAYIAEALSREEHRCITMAPVSRRQVSKMRKEGALGDLLNKCRIDAN